MTADSPCDHVWHFLKEHEMRTGFSRESSGHFSHYDEIFYCEKCLEFRAKVLDRYTKSIFSHNMQASVFISNQAY